MNINTSILDSLVLLEKSKSGFLIVTNNIGSVIGVLTDGDIRRAILRKRDLKFNIEEAYKKDFKYILLGSTFSDIHKEFSNVEIEFLPVLNYDSKLVNIIYRNQFYNILLESGFKDNAILDFKEFNDNTSNHFKLIERPWGVYRSIFLGNKSQSKIIMINPMSKLSLQLHKKREEYWVIISGNGVVTIGTSIKQVFPGDFIFIPKECRHMIENISESESLFMVETQLGEYFGEDDIIRISDIYGRK